MNAGACGPGPTSDAAQPAAAVVEDEQSKINRAAKILADLENRFTYHAPKPGQPEIYQGIRRQAYDLAVALVAACPEGRELSLAITRIEEAVFWANAGIARA